MTVIPGTAANTCASSMAVARDRSTARPTVCLAFGFNPATPSALLTTLSCRTREHCNQERLEERGPTAKVEKQQLLCIAQANACGFFLPPSYTFQRSRASPLARTPHAETAAATRANQGSTPERPAKRPDSLRKWIKDCGRPRHSPRWTLFAEQRSPRCHARASCYPRRIESTKHRYASCTPPLL